MAFCTQCGKNLNEGEVCDCKASESYDASSINSEDSSVLSVAAPKNIPYVSEILSIFKNTISKNTVKQVSLSAKENSILWVFIMLIESFVSSLALTVMIRSLAHKLITMTLKSNPFTGGLQSNTTKLLSNIGLGFFSLFFRMFIIGIAVFFITSALIYILLKICKKNCNFNNIGNMVSTAAIPLTFLSVISFVISFILPQIAILIYIVSLISALVLMYLGIQKVDKFTQSPFWSYMAFVFILLIGSFLTMRLLTPTIRLDQIFSGLF